MELDLGSDLLTRFDLFRDQFRKLKYLDQQQILKMLAEAKEMLPNLINMQQFHIGSLWQLFLYSIVNIGVLKAIYPTETGLAHKRVSLGKLFDWDWNCVLNLVFAHYSAPKSNQIERSNWVRLWYKVFSYFGLIFLFLVNLTYISNDFNHLVC